MNNSIDISIQAWIDRFFLYLDYNGKMLVLMMIVATSTMIREPDSLRATILALSMNLGWKQVKFHCKTWEYCNFLKSKWTLQTKAHAQPGSQHLDHAVCPWLNGAEHQAEKKEQHLDLEKHGEGAKNYEIGRYQTLCCSAQPSNWNWHRFYLNPQLLYHFNCSTVNT